MYVMEGFLAALSDAGFDVSTADSADAALELAQTETFDVVVLDIMMSPGRSLTQLETAGGFKTGLALARALTDLLPDARMIAFTVCRDPEIIEWFTRDSKVSYLEKPATRDRLVRQVARLLDPEQNPPRMFVVHGRDQATLTEVKEFFSSRPGFPELVILSEQPSRGLTIIEKFEAHASESDLALILLTPDDLGVLADSDDEPTQRARMNVVLELGYFFGALRRRSGRVFVLTKGNLEIPSDIAGVVYVDISAGVESAADEIHRELSCWLQSPA